MGYNVLGSAVNSGDGCAMNVAGTTSVTVTPSGALTEYPWTLSPTSKVIRPAERFDYLIVHLSRDQFLHPAGDGTSLTRFTFTATACST